VTYIHPDCGFWMLNRSIADGKMSSIVKLLIIFGSFDYSSHEGTERSHR
jgi:hypothetical protein